jgi:hypothetical protein
MDQQRWKEGKPLTKRAIRAHHYFSHLDVGIAPRSAVPPSLELRAQWARLLANKGVALGAIGDHATACANLAGAVALSKELSRGQSCWFCPPWSWPSVWSAVTPELFRQQPEPCYQLDLARHLALASTLPGAGGNSEVGARAVQALHHLAASGFDNAHKLRTDSRLAPLRKRQDFQELLRRLQGQAAKNPALARER